MSGTANHTATPWRVGRKGCVVADVPVPGMGGNDDVAYYGGHMVAESVTEANAAFIVKVVNLHEQLVAALRTAEELNTIHLRSASPTQIKRVGELRRAALAAAEAA